MGILTQVGYIYAALCYSDGACLQKLSQSIRVSRGILISQRCGYQAL